MSGVGLGGGSWIGSGGAGGVSGAANIGTAGVGPFDSLSAGTLQFKSINAGSNKITISDDLVNKEIDLDVDETKIDVRNLKNVSPGVNSSFVGWDNTGKLSQVPGFTFDDDGALRIGAQNSITVPAGLTDYYSIAISPTVSNTGLTNLFGVFLNTPIDQSVGAYTGYALYGYGTSAPQTYLGFISSPNYSGTGVDSTAFSGSSSWDVSGTIKGLNFAASGDAVTFEGISLFATGTYTNTTGINVDLSGATSTGRKVGITINEGSIGNQFTFDTVSSLPSLVDSGNVIRPVFQTKVGAAITGTDVLMTNLAGFMDFKANYSASPLNLGVSSVGFVSQVAAASGVTASNISMLTAGLAVEATSAGGTVTNAHLIRGFAANFGGTLNIGTIYGLQIESGMSALATLAFGISVDDQGTQNYVPRIVVSGVSKTVSSSDVAIDINDAKAFRLGRVTTAQRLAMTPLQGLMVYDVTTNKPYHADGTTWHQI